jgi:hypothetical protein
VHHWLPGTNTVEVGDGKTESMQLGDVILVSNGSGQEAEDMLDFDKQWKAHILQIKAIDSQHVYLRIYWVYRPEDLPGGRKPYHGENELIISNEMAIVDAMTANGKVTLIRWNDEDDNETPSNGSTEEPEYYWRQSYDFHNKRLSVPATPTPRSLTLKY